MSTSERATKICFWLAFGAFLAMSVPHVAWVFRFYEPKQDGYDKAWWVISYGVAVSIDLLICWLSYTRSEHHSSKGDGFITWVFILLLALLSWYCNWIFAETMIGVNVWSIALGWGWTVGSLTPLIVSAIPMFMIAYTYMSKRIIGAKSQPKTMAELQQELTDLRQMTAIKQQLSMLRNQQLSSWIAGKKQVLSDVLQKQNGAQIEEQSMPGSPSEDRTIEEEIRQEDTAETPLVPAQVLEVAPAQEAVRPLKYFMDFEEAARYTGYAVSTLRKQLNAGEIEANKNGDKLKVSTLKIRTGITAKMPIVKVEKVPATNGAR